MIPRLTSSRRYDGISSRLRDAVLPEDNTHIFHLHTSCTANPIWASYFHVFSIAKRYRSCRRCGSDTLGQTAAVSGKLRATTWQHDSRLCLVSSFQSNSISLQERTLGSAPQHTGRFLLAGGQVAWFAHQHRLEEHDNRPDPMELKRRLACVHQCLRGHVRHILVAVHRDETLVPASTPHTASLQLSRSLSAAAPALLGLSTANSDSFIGPRCAGRERRWLCRSRERCDSETLWHQMVNASEAAQGWLVMPEPTVDKRCSS
ncbi:hypothetical protein BS50DRAFT_348847 [Corynespora cassiicola Philippines]|uniref:Uncharacterized protein n=1 Tax=Corynespora cassiicola Philippines TaxID=1448308 RepID=A0A2T2NRR8_CORCC|nr:hypothetical protein BS50DRAFT_348847 [Corynespora cassiicola Philippines]